MMPFNTLIIQNHISCHCAWKISFYILKNQYVCVLVFPFLSFRLPLLISRWVTFARSAGHWCFSPPSVMLTQEASSFSVNFLRELRQGYLSSMNLVLFPWRKTCFYLFICPQVLIKGTTIHNAWSPYAVWFLRTSSLYRGLLFIQCCLNSLCLIRWSFLIFIYQSKQSNHL